MPLLLRQVFVSDMLGFTAAIQAMVNGVDRAGALRACNVDVETDAPQILVGEDALRRKLIDVVEGAFKPLRRCERCVCVEVNF